jgi:hypothetical protein
MYADTVDLLDLCILAYQLHAQTLYMRADPYGEYMRSKTKSGDAAHTKGRHRRERFLQAVGVEMKKLTRPTTGPSFGGPGYMRSPQSTMWPMNDKLDPILSDYTRISPQLLGLVQSYKGYDGWITYRSPTSITGPIGQVFMVEYGINNGPNSQKPEGFVKPVAWPLAAPANLQTQPDLLYCFEGGTGGIRNKASDGAVWSLMGFVLAREDTASTQTPKPYDVFIVFRGSRSGRVSGPRMSSYFVLSKGNPDWVTDLDLATTSGRTQVSSHTTHRGFATAMTTMLPTIEAALSDLVTKMKNNRPTSSLPRNIYVTGHSLGGALATCFASAVLCGDFKKRLQQTTPNWPWHSLSLKTFAAPPAGEIDFTLNLNTACMYAENWRLPNDIVPKLALWAKQYSYRAVGKDMCLPSNADKETSHSPDHMRDIIQAYLALQPQPFNRTIEKEKPWKVERDLENLLVTLSTELQKVTARDWYSFKKGLQIYLSALSNMKENPPGTQDRFNANEKTIIQDFVIKSLAKNVSDFQFFMGTDFQELLKVEKIWDDEDLQWNIRAWLALAAAEDGYQWKAGDTNLKLAKKQ